MKLRPDRFFMKFILSLGISSLFLPNILTSLNAANYPSGYDTFVEKFNARKDIVGSFWSNPGQWLDDPLDAWVYSEREQWRGWRQAAIHFGDPNGVISGYAEASVAEWRDRYVLKNNGGVPGYYIYTEGYTEDFLFRGDQKSKDAAILQALNAAYARDSTPLASYESEGRSRSVAYSILSYVNTEAHLNQPHRKRLKNLVDFTLGDVGDQIVDQLDSSKVVNLDKGGHIEQWLGTYVTDVNGNYVSGNHNFKLGSGHPTHGLDQGYAPFMGAYAAYALIRFHEQASAGELDGGNLQSDLTKILSKLKRLADATWNEYWIASDEALKYRWYSVSDPDYVDQNNNGPLPPFQTPITKGASDVANVIFPWYAWLYLQTGEDRFRNRAEKIFNGSRNSYGPNGGSHPLTASKQWNDYLRHTFDGLAWYSQGVTTHLNPAPWMRTLTVNSGHGGGSYDQHQKVRVVANPPDLGMTFDKWTGDIEFLSDKTLPNTIMTIPSFDATITATYKVGPPPNVKLPTLPQAHVDISWSLPTNGKTWNVDTAADFQDALDNSTLGDVIVLNAGQTYTGEFTLRDKGAGSEWIYIVSSELSKLPNDKTRISENDLQNMPRIESTRQQGNTLKADSGAHHYRIVGIDIASTYVGTQVKYNIVRLVGVDNIIFDRCIVRGHPEGNNYDGFSVSGVTNFAVINSRITDIHVAQNQQESHGIQVASGKGPILLQNNFWEVAGINIFFGGNGTSGSPPQDVTVRGNHVRKDLNWQNPIPSGPNAGLKWKVKNLIEWKAANRILVEGNIFEHHWNHLQAHAVVLTPRGADLSDITFRKNIIQNINMAFNLAPTSASGNQRRIDRLLIENNLIRDVVGNRIFNFTRGSTYHGTHLTIRHNTAINDSGATLYFENGAPVFEFVSFSDNLFKGGVNSTGRNPSMADMTVCDHLSNFIFNNEAYIGQKASNFKGPLFQNFMYPVDVTAVGFRDTNFDWDEYDDFALLPTSAYAAGNANQASDGKDMGADIAGLIALVTGVKQGNPDLPDPPSEPDPDPTPDPVQAVEIKKFMNYFDGQSGTPMSMPCESDVSVMTIKGEVVLVLNCPDGGGEVFWHAVNSVGQNVANGIYYFYQEGKKVLKGAVIR